MALDTQKYSMTIALCLWKGECGAAATETLAWGVSISPESLLVAGVGTSGWNAGEGKCNPLRITPIKQRVGEAG